MNAENIYNNWAFHEFKRKPFKTGGFPCILSLDKIGVQKTQLHMSKYIAQTILKTLDYANIRISICGDYLINCNINEIIVWLSRLTSKKMSVSAGNNYKTAYDTFDTNCLPFGGGKDKLPFDEPYVIKYIDTHETDLMEKCEVCQYYFHYDNEPFGALTTISSFPLKELWDSCIPTEIYSTLIERLSRFNLPISVRIEDLDSKTIDLFKQILVCNELQIIAYTYYCAYSNIYPVVVGLIDNEPQYDVKLPNKVFLYKIQHKKCPVISELYY